MYVEGFGAATLVNGVVRIETLYRNGKGEDVRAGELLIPVVRLLAIQESVRELVDQIQAQNQQQVAGNA